MLCDVARSVEEVQGVLSALHYEAVCHYCSTSEIFFDTLFPHAASSISPPPSEWPKR